MYFYAMKTNIRQPNNVIYLSFWLNVLFIVINESMYKCLKLYKLIYLKYVLN